MRAHGANQRQDNVSRETARARRGEVGVCAASWPFTKTRAHERKQVCSNGRAMRCTTYHARCVGDWRRGVVLLFESANVMISLMPVTRPAGNRSGPSFGLGFTPARGVLPRIDLET